MKKKSRARAKKPAPSVREALARAAAVVNSVAPPPSDESAITLTAATELRVIRKALENRGWSPDAIERILDYTLDNKRRSDIFAPSPIDVGTVRPASEIESALHCLEREVDRLGDVVSEVVAQLGPVMAPPGPPADVNEAGPGFPTADSTTAGTIIGAARKAKVIGDELWAAKGRLRV